MSTPSAQAQPAIKVTADHSRTFALPEHFNGVNTQMMRGPEWRADGFIQQVQQLHPAILRYPGGTVASYWDWKTGWLKEGVEWKKEWVNIKRHPLTLHELKFACDSTGAIPLFVLNMMTSTLEDQLQMLHAAKKIGLAVSLIELDNELYFTDRFYVQRFPTGKDYAKECNRWINTIKKEFPSVKIGVVGYSVREGASQRGKVKPRLSTWNRDVLSVIENADAMTFHVYSGSGMGYLTGMMDDDDQESKQSEIAKHFETPASIPIILGVPFTRWKSVVAYDLSLLPKEMEAWITEYNLFEREGVVAGTWAHGLYVAALTLLFPNHDKIRLISYHNLVTSAQFGALFYSNDGFHKAYKKPPTTLYGMTAAGYALSLTNELFRDSETLTPLKFSPNPELKGARGQTYPSLIGWMANGNGKTKAVIINLSPKSYNVDFSSLFKGDVSFQQISSDPHRLIATEKDLRSTEGSALLAPYSITLVTGN